MDYEYFDGWDFGEYGTPEDGLYSGTAADPIGGFYDGKARVALRTQERGASETIPENVQGKFTIIFAIARVRDENEVKNQLW